MGGGHHEDLSLGTFGDPKQGIEGPCMNRTLGSIGAGACAGTFFGACKVAWYPDAITTTPGRFAGGTLGKTDLAAVGRTIARPVMWFSLVAGTFSFVDCISESLRNDKRDAWNGLAGGMAAGAVIGMTTGRPQAAAAASIGMGLLMAAESLSGYKTVYDESALWSKRHNTLPETHVESAKLAALKEKYPQHKNL